jgi:hypothetical protein
MPTILENLMSDHPEHVVKLAGMIASMHADARPAASVLADYAEEINEEDHATSLRAFAAGHTDGMWPPTVLAIAEKITPNESIVRAFNTPEKNRTSADARRRFNRLLMFYMGTLEAHEAAMKRGYTDGAVAEREQKIRRLAAAWERVNGRAFDGFDPATAEGAALERIAQLVGISRLPPEIVPRSDHGDRD